MIRYLQSAIPLTDTSRSHYHTNMILKKRTLPIIQRERNLKLHVSRLSFKSAFNFKAIITHLDLLKHLLKANIY